eukprot:CAMPEP_0206461052 /NCGR_PEP_ID=MMETSP0324_2-20121206/25113_1 /ASSEMBLY_ACC=CAM_ASM_000836 /TAXON_ID=2866 /ORGANISM="Crypthecodinium cohnii, Strain Seligo" /LENGTH=75 /DNA_ID=CAMNT_0053932863 /DNA_START=752 /DNA_END=979 /DNA_ORIENTATION=+
MVLVEGNVMVDKNPGWHNYSIGTTKAGVSEGRTRADLGIGWVNNAIKAHHPTPTRSSALTDSKQQAWTAGNYSMI